jgi:hypothetical protein
MAGNALGVAIAALQYGYSSSVPKQQRSFGGLKGYVTFDETHTDELDITDHPIEQGALVSDHAFLRPAVVVMRCGWSNSPSDSTLLGGVRGALNTIGIATSNILGEGANQVNDIYQQIRKLQSERIPFEVFTGKRVYEDMLIKTLQVRTDKDTENVLDLTVTFRQILRVTTSTVRFDQAPAANQRDAAETSAPVNAGSKQLAPGDKISVPAAEAVLGN